MQNTAPADTWLSPSLSAAFILLRPLPPLVFQVHLGKSSPLGCSGMFETRGTGVFKGWMPLLSPSQQWHSLNGHLASQTMPTSHTTKIGNFGDVLPSQSLGIVLKELNLTQQKQTAQEKMAKNTRCKTKSKENLNQQSTLKNCSHVCAYHCAQLSYTIQHRIVLMIFSLILCPALLWHCWLGVWNLACKNWVMRCWHSYLSGWVSEYILGYLVPYNGENVIKM